MFAAFRLAVQEARGHKDLYFAGLLSQHDIDSAMGNATALARRWIYKPIVTLTVFLTQCLSPDHSCREAVSKLLAWRTKQGLTACSIDTGPYCTARDALPETACHALARNVGRDLDSQAPTSWLWKGRRTYVVDGSTVTMPDTPANQAVYPQQKQQMPGIGFPIARIIVVFSLAVGTAVEMTIGKYKGKLTGENSMFRELHKFFQAKDVIIADRAYAGWFDIALCVQRGIDLITRKHQNRNSDFRSGKRLGKDDHVVTIQKPDRPKWMDKKTYASLPETLQLRQVRIRITQKGFRTKEIIVETTLLDDLEFTKRDLGQAFRRRWDAELNLRSLKIVLQMDHLRCKTPHRVHNEFYMHMLAYNLIRKTIAIAATHHGVQPYQISFKGALQTLMNFLASLHVDTDLDQWCIRLLSAIASEKVGNRPDRVEPRVKKRRPKPYKQMTKPRSEYKKDYQ
jgi:hypothetical protein